MNIHDRYYVSGGRRASLGFTLVEIVVVISILGILAAIGTVSYSAVQHRASDVVTRDTANSALESLKVYNIRNKNYPSNLANTDFIAPLTVAVAFYTDAAQKPFYPSLTSEENAQLFINACNGLMPITSGSTTYNTSCSYAGNNMHVSGQNSSNIVIKGPVVDQSEFVLECGPACDAVQAQILSIFAEQGGGFPISVPKNGATLPPPQLITSGTASNFCLEARSAQYDDIVYHALPAFDRPAEGPCPNNPSLHYP